LQPPASEHLHCPSAQHDAPGHVHSPATQQLPDAQLHVSSEQQESAACNCGNAQLKNNSAATHKRITDNFIFFSSL